MQPGSDSHDHDLDEPASGAGPETGRRGFTKGRMAVGMVGGASLLALGAMLGGPVAGALTGGTEPSAASSPTTSAKAGSDEKSDAEATADHPGDADGDPDAGGPGRCEGDRGGPHGRGPGADRGPGGRDGRGGFLKALVDDGTLTDDQATALRKLFVEHRPERPAEADRPAAGDRPTEAERTKAREAREAARTKALDETLSAAVDAGTIDQKEADAVRSKAEDLKAQRPERPEKSGDDADAGKGSATDGSGG